MRSHSVVAQANLKQLLIVSAIAAFTVIGAASADVNSDAYAPADETGTASGSASLNGTLRDDQIMNREAESEIQARGTFVPNARRTPEDTAVSDPLMRRPAPVKSRAAISDSTQSSQSSAYSAPVNQQSQATFPDLERLDTRNQMRPTIGLLTGFQNVKGPAESTIAYGIDIGFNILVPLSVGLEFSYAPSDIDVGSLEADFNSTNYLTRAYYNFGGDVSVLKNTYVGWKLGVTRYGNSNDSDTRLALGPVLGMDFPLDHENRFTLGPQAQYLTVLDADDQFALQAVARYWF